MFESTLILWLVDRLDSMDEHEAISFLEKRGWKHFNGCCEQYVLQKKGIPFVIKISREDFWDQEFFKKEIPYRWEKVQKSHYARFFAETKVFALDNFVVSFQEKVEKVIKYTFDQHCRKGFKKAIEGVCANLGLEDIRGGNCGISKGQLKIFDFQSERAHGGW